MWIYLLECILSKLNPVITTHRYESFLKLACVMTHASSSQTIPASQALTPKKWWATDVVSDTCVPLHVWSTHTKKGNSTRKLDSLQCNSIPVLWPGQDRCCLCQLNLTDTRNQLFRLWKGIVLNCKGIVLNCWTVRHCFELYDLQNWIQTFYVHCTVYTQPLWTNVYLLH